jgi:hypothetical protein
MRLAGIGRPEHGDKARSSGGGSPVRCHIDNIASRVPESKPEAL